MDRHIVAIGGGGFSESGELTGIEREIAGLARRPDDRLRVCYLPNAGGDRVRSIERFHQAWGELDAELSVLTLFRREVDDITAHLRGQDLIFLAGVSAGGICRHAHGITTTFSRRHPTVVDGRPDGTALEEELRPGVLEGDLIA